MKSEQLESVWVRYQAGGPDALSAQELQWLENQLEARPALVKTFADERIVDALMRLEASGEEATDRFVNGTLTRIRSGDDVEFDDDQSDVRLVVPAPETGPKNTDSKPRSPGRISALPTIAPTPRNSTVAPQVESSDSQQSSESGKSSESENRGPGIERVASDRVTQQETDGIEIQRPAAASSNRWMPIAIGLAIAAAFAFIVVSVVLMSNRPPREGTIADENGGSPPGVVSEGVAGNGDPESRPDDILPGNEPDSRIADGTTQPPEGTQPELPRIDEPGREVIAGGSEIPDDPGPDGNPNPVDDGNADDPFGNSRIADSNPQGNVPVDPGENVSPVEQNPGGIADNNRPPAAPAVVTNPIGEIVDLQELMPHESTAIGPVGIGRVVFLTGFGSMNLNNGVMLRFQGPCEFVIERENRIVLHRGIFQVVTPKDSAAFEVLTEDHRWLIQERSELLVRFQPNGHIEGRIEEGSAFVEPERAAAGVRVRDAADLTATATPSKHATELKSRVLNRIVISPGGTVPGISMAEGRRKFSGRIGSGDNTWQTGSIDLFAETVAAVEQLRLFSGGLDLNDAWEGLAINQPEFARVDADIVDAIRSMDSVRVPQNVAPNGFERLLENNGQLLQSMTEEELKELLERSQQELLDGAGGRNPAPSVHNQRRQNESLHKNRTSRSFDGRISINGRTLRFESGELFDEFRNELNRLTR